MSVPIRHHILRPWCYKLSAAKSPGNNGKVQLTTWFWKRVSQMFAWSVTNLVMQIVCCKEAAQQGRVRQGRSA